MTQNFQMEVLHYRQKCNPQTVAINEKQVYYCYEMQVYTAPLACLDHWKCSLGKVIQKHQSSVWHVCSGDLEWYVANTFNWQWVQCIHTYNSETLLSTFLHNKCAMMDYRGHGSIICDTALYSNWLMPKHGYHLWLLPHVLMCLDYVSIHKIKIHQLFGLNNI